MNTTLAVTATAERVRGVLPLAGLRQLFLSVYMPTAPSETTAEGVRLSLAAKLSDISRRIAGTRYQVPFNKERQELEEFMLHLQTGGRAVAVWSSIEASVRIAMCLPTPILEHVRFGPGAYTLPLLDLLDELEPIVLAVVAKDKACVLVLEAGRIGDRKEVASEVPGLTRVGGGAARARRGGGQSGGASARYQRHHLAHVRRHLDATEQIMYTLARKYNVRRLFLAGPPEVVAMFKDGMRRELKDKWVADLSLDAYASEEEVRVRVLQVASEVERRGEETLVQDLVTRSAKEEAAVVGLGPTLWAISRHQVHLLVMADGGNTQPGGLCPSCDMLWPPEDTRCPNCAQKNTQVDLWDEIPGLALREGVPLEVVHGQAASLLRRYDGMAALVKPPSSR